jgi:hypothetical protein
MLTWTEAYKNIQNILLYQLEKQSLDGIVSHKLQVAFQTLDRDRQRFRALILRWYDKKSTDKCNIKITHTNSVER